VTSAVDDEDVRGQSTPAGSAPLRRLLVAIIAIAALAIAVAGGFAWGSHSNSNTSAKPSAVDIGFARDMSNHHQQAVEMAAYARDNSTDIDVVHLAYDIEQNQSLEEGEMTGWLDTWGLTRYDPHPMAWMGAQHAEHVVNGLMPGMATPSQMARLQSLHGKALDIFFLQLMIHHHQGGAPMAQYAVQHAGLDYVRTLAGHMLANQDTETIQMEQLLRQLGGAPLPAPLT
jgi:Uncharacterized protein conserved in bacteria